MVRWTVIFLIVAMIAGLLGFGGITEEVASWAKILFYIFIGLFLMSLSMVQQPNKVK